MDFRRLGELEERRVAFAVATVVGRCAPTSAHLGDRAVVFPDGRFEGFVGGACAHELVRRSALHALEARKAVLLQIRPDASDAGRWSDPHTYAVRMSCASEGSVDVYIEPHLPARRLLVVGRSPVARALARLGRAAEYEVIAVALASEVEERGDEPHAPAAQFALDDLPGFLAALEPLDREQTFAVVATLGHYDEDALEPFVRASLPYVGLLAGAKRAAGVKAALAARGFESAELDAIHAPVGLDLGAVEPADVALSILAEIVAVRRALARNAPPPTDASRDPVCGMSVKTSGARYTAQHDGTTVFFCCAGCREAFIAEPSRYAVGLS